MAARWALQLGRKLQTVPFRKPMVIARPITCQAMMTATEFITPGFKFGHKPFSWFAALHGLDVPMGEDGLPVSVNWSLIPGAVWDAPDQGVSGYCFRYAALGSVRSLNYLVTGELIEPSIQQMIDCSTLKGSICGGEPYEDLQYIIDGGGVLTADLYPPTFDKEDPATLVKEACKKVKGPGISIDSWMFVKPKCEAALKYAVSYQPVVVSIGVTHGLKVFDKPIKFWYYEEGILKGPSSTTLDHSVLLIGYDVLDGDLFWWCLNSYGKLWGIKGLFRLARGKTGSELPGGTLGILREALVPLKLKKENNIVVSRCNSCETCF